MRDFAKTDEPSGDAPAATGGHSFVIQKHAARRLHYDFRLELDGVLLSWSVPKGPSLSPTQRRLAVRTEDHPLGYANFEGIIPAGQYGGGTVAVWDRGSWTPEGDPREGMKKGRLTFTLDGEKLHGRWHLVKTRPSGKQEQWLLFKGRDDAANDQLDITEAKPASVISGRTIEEIADAKDRVWQSNRQPQNTNINTLLDQLPLGFKLSSLDKVLYPQQGITKGDLIAYLAVVAEWMLPHVAKRPLTLVRCPEGMTGKPCFFQKVRLPGSPAAVHPIAVKEEAGDVVNYMQIVDMPGLVALAQLGTLELHTWGCHTDKIERPDLMVLDLDPDPSVGWDHVALAAFDVRKRLNAIGIKSWLKTTGGKGLHVVVPIKRTLDWDHFKAWTKQFVEQMEADEPKLYTSNMSKAARRGKIFVDYLRNGRNATAIAPYSPRARAGAPVSVPITWEELARGVDPAAWTTRTVPKRLAQLKADPWADLLATHQTLPKL